MTDGRDQLRIGFFSAQAYDIEYFERANRAYRYDIVFHEARLYAESKALAAGFDVICVFVQDELDAQVLNYLAQHGTKTIALRCAGFNNVDIEAASEHEINVIRVPRYSPYAVAEHSIALMLALNRHIAQADQRIHQYNFDLNGLLGFDLHGKTAGVVGTGNIGAIVAGILRAFGMQVLAYDIEPNPACRNTGVEYTTLHDIWQRADIISLHCPLTPQTHHLINSETLAAMKRGVMLINTSRGAVIDTAAVIEALKSGKLGYLGLDVYEQEGDLFFRDLSGQTLADDVFKRLLTFPNVLITGHQGFFTHEALTNIAETTLANIQSCHDACTSDNLVTPHLYQ